MVPWCSGEEGDYKPTHKIYFYRPLFLTSDLLEISYTTQIDESRSIVDFKNLVDFLHSVLLYKEKLLSILIGVESYRNYDVGNLKNIHLQIKTEPTLQ